MNVKFMALVITLLLGGYSFAQDVSVSPQESKIEQQEPENIIVEREKIQRCEDLIKEAETRLKNLEEQHSKLLQEKEDGKISDIEALLKNQPSKTDSRANDALLLTLSLEIAKLQEAISDLKELIQRSEVRIICINAEPITLPGEHIDYASKLKVAKQKHKETSEKMVPAMMEFNRKQEEKRSKITLEQQLTPEGRAARLETFTEKSPELEEIFRKAKEQYNFILYLEAAQNGGIPNSAASYEFGGSGRVQVKGYFRKDGTYVRPHTRSYPKR